MLHIIAILSVSKSRPGEPSILQEATFIFVLPAPSTATASEVHTTVQWVNNECIDGCDQPEQVEEQVFCPFHDTYTGTYTCTFVLILIKFYCSW